jgi:mRNA-degrading endonuclease YafQ of YafQ-DinJ toxin-antitoxin module
VCIQADKPENYELIKSGLFEKNWSKFILKNRLVDKNQAEKRLKILSNNPNNPKLSTHLIKCYGKNKRFYSSSLDFSIRIIWYKQENSLIYLHNIGPHDVVY